MKKTTQGKAAKARKSTASKKVAIKDLPVRGGMSVKGGRMWTKGGGASVG
ncbi:MAG TPA: hypothetical protein VMJ30_03215 [Gemmatimonadales bacterium]|nr:hypothetical protein [Gemmatimonadales bacterium]